MNFDFVFSLFLIYHSLKLGLNCLLLLLLLLPLLSPLFGIIGDVGDGEEGILLLTPFAILLVSITRILIVSFPKSIFSFLDFFWVTFNSNTYFVSVGLFGAIK